MRKFLQPLFAAFIFLLPLSCFAWGTEGHRVVGEIASRHLTKKARQRISAILGDETIAVTSNWADFIKSDTAYRYLNPWHYVDLPGGMTHDAVMNFFANDTTTDVYTKINYVKDQLKNKNLPQEQQVFYLKMLIHMVEDIHQPLHTIDSAQGGNGIKVVWFGDPTNLHTVWDSDLILFQQYSYTEYADVLDHANKKQIANWQSGTLQDWIYESYNIGEAIVNEIKDPNQKLSYRYNFDHVATLNQQLEKGGIRLAKVLNDIFG